MHELITRNIFFCVSSLFNLIIFGSTSKKVELVSDWAGIFMPKTRSRHNLIFWWHKKFLMMLMELLAFITERLFRGIYSFSSWIYFFRLRSSNEGNHFSTQTQFIFPKKVLHLQNCRENKCQNVLTRWGAMGKINFCGEQMIIQMDFECDLMGW